MKERLRPLLFRNRFAYLTARRVYQLGRFLLRRPHERDFRAFALFRDKSGTFLDVGANSGMSALSFRLFHRGSDILSIEANPHHEGELRMVSRIIRRFDYRICAASDQNGSATLYVPAYRNVPLTGLASLTREPLEDSWSLRELLGDRYMESPHFEILEEPVELRRLDDLDCAPDFVKIDVEGGEIGVLRGLERTIARHRPIIMIERGDSSEVVDRVGGLLEGRGYGAYSYLPDARRFEPYRNEPALNVFFMPTELAASPAAT